MEQNIINRLLIINFSVSMEQNIINKLLIINFSVKSIRLA